MVWCPTCGEDVEVDYNEQAAMSCCMNCGRVLEDIAFSSDVTFVKGADGEGELVGQFVSESGAMRGLQRMAGGKVWSMRGDSHEASLNKGRLELSSMIDHFVIRPAQEILEAAHRLYRLAVQAGFTKGRQVPQVAACCLYIICRQESKAFMLIDLSDLLQVNVYRLGAVYLQLCKLLRIEDHPSLTKPIDPSLYLQRFVLKLGTRERAKETAVGTTALRLISQMKRDWMQTGRRPAGICGAALWLACHLHDIPRTKADVMGIVHVGWGTLDKRVKEFSANAVANLTLGEFEKAYEQAEQQQANFVKQLEYKQQQHRRKALKGPGGASTSGQPEQGPDEQTLEQQMQQQQELQQACEHIIEGTAMHSAMGMCQSCFTQFLQTSGGIWGDAADPPAYRDSQCDGLDANQINGDVQPIGLLEAAPGHGTDAEIIADMAANEEERRQQLALAREAAAAAAAASGRGRGRSRARGRGRKEKGPNRPRGRPRKVPLEVPVDAGEGADIVTPAAAGVGSADAGGNNVQQDVDAQIAELDSALHELHDAVCHLQQSAQQQQQEQQQHPAAAPAAAACSSPPASAVAPSVARGAAAAGDEADGGEQEFGASLLGYGSACLQQRSRPQEQQREGQPPAKRTRRQQQNQQADKHQQQTADKQQQPQSSDADGDSAAAVVRSATEGLGLHPTAAELIIGAVEELTAETGAIVPVPATTAVEGSESGGDTDLEAVDDDEIASYIRPATEVKLKELLWNSLHKDWLQAQEAKVEQARAAAEATAAARKVAQENEDAAAGAVKDGETTGDVLGEDGQPVVDGAGPAPGKKPRGKPGAKKGSHHKRPTALPEADSVAAAARANVEANKKLSDKINYKVLDDLFDSAAGAAGGSSSKGSFGPKHNTAADLYAEPAGSSFKAALARQAQQRAAAEQKTTDRYSQQLEAEAKKRGSTVGFNLAELSGLPPLPGASGTAAESEKPRPGGLRTGRLGSLRR